MLWQAVVSLCRGHVVDEDAGVDPHVEVRVVLHRFVLCVSAYSVFDVSMLVLCGWSFGSYLCICGSRAFGLQGWACVRELYLFVVLEHQEMCHVNSPGCHCAQQ